MENQENNQENTEQPVEKNYKDYMVVGANPITTINPSTSGATEQPEQSEEEMTTLTKEEQEKLAKKQEKAFKKMVKKIKHNQNQRYWNQMISKRKVNKGRKAGRSGNVWTNTPTEELIWKKEDGQKRGKK